MRRNRRVSTVKKQTFEISKQYWWVGIILLAITCYELSIHYAEPRLLPIKHIKLQAQCDRIDETLIKQHTTKFTKGFFTTDVMRLKNKLQKLPYVEEVSIKRIWPDTLLVTIIEQKFVAAWGKSGAVSSKGVVASLPEVDQHLPKFVGPEGQANVMLETYNAISKIIEPFALKVRELDLNGRRSWQVKLDNNLKIIMGRKDYENKLLALMSVYPKLKKRHGNDIDTIDLRYPNGICVHAK